VKDQTESFFYFPSLHLQRVVGGFGGFIIINNRPIILIPFDTPYGDLLFSLEIGTPAIIYQVLVFHSSEFPFYVLNSTIGFSSNEFYVARVLGLGGMS